MASKVFNFVGVLNNFTIYIYGFPVCFGKLMSSNQNFVLVSFSLSLTASIHDLMSSIDSSIIVMVSSSSVCIELPFPFGIVGLNDFLIEWSSAKPFMVNDFGII